MISLRLSFNESNMGTSSSCRFSLIRNAKGVRKALHSWVNGCAKQSLTWKPSKTIKRNCLKKNVRICGSLPKKNGTLFFFAKSILSISLRRGPSLWCQKATCAAYLGFTFGLSSGLSLGASFSLGTWQLKRVKLCGKISDYTIVYLCLVLHIYTSSWD